MNQLQDDTLENNFLEMMQHSYPTQTKDKSKSRRRRALPLIRLAMDPNSKLNMPKTLENIGTIARNSFEDKHAPMYHVRNMIGSVKNAFMSGLRVAPHDLIIPSQYRIIDTKEEMVMKPSEIEEIKTRAAADATAAAESRAARDRERERRREALTPPKPFEIVQTKPQNDFMTRLESLKSLFKNPLITPKPKTIDESALRRKAFGLGTEGAPILGSRMNTDDNEVDPFDFLKTFQKVGSVVRGSIKSGQETIQHISEAAHSARKAYNTARFGAPRVLLPYARAPVVENDNKLMFIAPRFLDIDKEDPTVGMVVQPMVGMGEIMNAFGVANPEAAKVQKQRIIVEKTHHPQPGKVPIFEARFGGGDEHVNSMAARDNDNQYFIYAEDIDEEEEPPIVEDTLKSLQSLKDIVGAKTITEFLEDMKKDFTSLHVSRKVNDIQDLKSQMTDAQVSSRIAEETEEEEQELKRFLNDLFADQTAKIDRNYEEAKLQQQQQSNIPVTPPQDVHVKQQLKEQSPSKNDEILGSKLFLPQNLLKPFMNQPNTEQLNDYFRENGDVEEIKDNPNENFNNFLRMHALVAAINPQMYKELFNQTLKIYPNSTVLHPEDLFNNTKLGTTRNIEQMGREPEGDLIQMRSQFSPEQNKNENLASPDQAHPITPENQQPQRDDEEKKRISMHFHKKLTKPFMGKVKPKTEYYYDYGYDDNY